MAVDLRGLVGMSMGARKRAARGMTAARDFVGADAETLWAFIWTEYPEHLRPADRRDARHAFHELALSDAVPMGTYMQERAALLIGERLRPCPCLLRGVRPCNCDGSGVLPTGAPQR